MAQWRRLGPSNRTAWPLALLNTYLHWPDTWAKATGTPSDLNAASLSPSYSPGYSLPSPTLCVLLPWFFSPRDRRHLGGLQGWTWASEPSSNRVYRLSLPSFSSQGLTASRSFRAQPTSPGGAEEHTEAGTHERELMTCTAHWRVLATFHSLTSAPLITWKGKNYYDL